MSGIARAGRALMLGLAFASVACGGKTAPPPSVVPPSASSAPPTVAAALAPPIRVVAAENFYGDLAAQIGGDRVTVVAILSDPNTDPHEYESNADDAKAVANAQVVIKNSLGYDAFVDKLMGASPRPNRVVIDVSEVTGHKEGDNPHVWYDPTTMPRVAERLAAALSQIEPADKEYFAGRVAAFQLAEKGVDDQVAATRAKYAGIKVLPTEPVFDYMAEALGLDVVDKEGAFQKAVEEGNDPPAQAIGDFRKQLTSHAIKVLIYNSQAVTPITTQMRDLAKQNGISFLPISETEPAGKTYQQWMVDQIKDLQTALGGP